MKSEKTEKELAEAMVSAWGRFDLSPRSTGDFDNWRAAARVAAQTLGVELATERPALPGWAEEELESANDAPHPVIRRPCGRFVRLGVVTGLTIQNQSRKLIAERKANRAAFVEIHRRWLAAKREMKRINADNRAAHTFLGRLWRILDGRDRA